MAFADDGGNESVPVSTTILPNTWYDATLTFGNTSLVGTSNQDVAGTASLFLNGSLVSQAPAIKGTSGDGMDRPIGVGQLGAPFGYLVGFKGDIYNPTVELGVVPVPEPSTLAQGRWAVWGWCSSVAGNPDDNQPSHRSSGWYWLPD